MRLLENISHPHCRISIFSWNGKYIIELEWGQLKQSFKISHDSVNGVEQVRKMVNVQFLDEAFLQFQQMHSNLAKTFQESHI
ncbi:MAG: hypothetical protein SGI87_09080 [Flavobacteriales bacterium]|nr:hypothetical protein [Flavobacteriales bacterium]